VRCALERKSVIDEEAHQTRATLAVLTRNPIYVLARAYRSILLESKAPDWISPGWLSVVSIAVFLLGHARFYKLRKSFADLI
jgi:ABC-type polysaccharide/polyol phosphate export permease